MYVLASLKHTRKLRGATARFAQHAAPRKREEQTEQRRERTDAEEKALVLVYWAVRYNDTCPKIGCSSVSSQEFVVLYTLLIFEAYMRERELRLWQLSRHSWRLIIVRRESTHTNTSHWHWRSGNARHTPAQTRYYMENNDYLSESRRTSSRRVVNGDTMSLHMRDRYDAFGSRAHVARHAAATEREWVAHSSAKRGTTRTRNTHRHYAEREKHYNILNDRCHL